MGDKEPTPSQWRENLVAIVLFLFVLGLLIFTAGGNPPFIYGRF